MSARRGSIVRAVRSRRALAHHVEDVMGGVLPGALALDRVVVAHEAIVARQHFRLGATFVSLAHAVVNASIHLGVKVRVARVQFEHRERRARKDDEAHREDDEQARRFELLRRLLWVVLRGQIGERVHARGYFLVAAHDIRGFVQLGVLLLRAGRWRLRGSDLRRTGLEFIPVDRAVLVGVIRLHELGPVNDAVLVLIHRVEQFVRSFAFAVGGQRAVPDDAVVGHGHEIALNIGEELGKVRRPGLHRGLHHANGRAVESKDRRCGQVRALRCAIRVRSARRAAQLVRAQAALHPEHERVVPLKDLRRIIRCGRRAAGRGVVLAGDVDFARILGRTPALLFLDLVLHRVDDLLLSGQGRLRHELGALEDVKHKDGEHDEDRCHRRDDEFLVVGVLAVRNQGILERNAPGREKPHGAEVQNVKPARDRLVHRRPRHVDDAAHVLRDDLKVSEHDLGNYAMLGDLLL